MKTLVVAATHAELTPLLKHFNLHDGDYIQHQTFDVLITGVGMTATAFALGQHIHKNYNLILNLGIAGSFDQSINLGDVVNIIADTISELGAHTPAQFLTIDELGFGKSTFFGKSVPGIKNVKGITVNTVHGDASGIAEIISRVNPQAESMEGAAVFYCGQKAGIDCLQVRSISNFVEPRNKDNWQIGPAIKNLNEWAITFLTADN